MAIHWQIKFRSLRANTLYTVNVYDASYSGDPVQLTGAANPFETQEDDSDDLFQAVRTQSGYLRIVDTGKDNAGNDFDWRTFIPTTDTDRPVTLTDGGGNVVWMGFMQAQNFGARLYDMPQGREFPLQCPLATLSRLDVDWTAFDGTKNFAALIDYAFNNIPTIGFEQLFIQGGADARTWLLKEFDWMLFTDTDDDGNQVNSTDLLTAFDGVCRYWGLTARMQGTTLYLMAPDDQTGFINRLELTRQQLTELAGGSTSAGRVYTDVYVTQAVTDEFASTATDDAQQRGVNKAVMTSEVGDIDDRIVFGFPDSVMKQMYDGGWVQESGYRDYTPDLTQFSNNLEGGTSGYVVNGSFNIMRLRAGFSGITTDETMPVIRHKSGYNGELKAEIHSLVAHVFPAGHFTIKGKTYQNGNHLDYSGEHGRSNKHTRMCLGIGMTEAAAMWWNGYEWVNSKVEFYAEIARSDDVLPTSTSKLETSPVYSDIQVPASGLKGFLYVKFYGSDDLMENISGCYFDLADFEITYQQNTIPYRYTDPERHESRSYTATNDAMVKGEWEGSSIFATDNYSKWGPGLVLNPNGTLFTGWNYPNHTEGTTPPEQHTADRVAQYWSQSRRMISCELRHDLLPELTPRHLLTIDGTTLYPFSISHQWRDDVVITKSLEI